MTRAELPAQAAAGSGLDAPRRGLPVVLWVLAVYIAGVTIFGKGPTYLFVGPVPWGEIVLVMALAWTLAEVVRDGVPRDLPRVLLFLIACFLVCGGALTLRSLGAYPLRDVARDSMVWYYALFAFVGLLAARRRETGDSLWGKFQILWLLALVWVAAYPLGTAWLARKSSVTFRGVPLLSGSGSENYQHMFLGAALLFLRPARVRRLRVPTWLSVALVLGALVTLTVCRGRGVKLGCFLALLAGLLATTGARQRLWPTGRGAIVAYLALNAVLVMAVLSGTKGLVEIGRLHRFTEIWTHKGTAYWRRDWWGNLHREVWKDPERRLFGLGFGKNLADFSTFERRQQRGDWPVRSPHSVNMTVYARMGLVGTAVWSGVLAVGLGGFFWRVRSGKNRYGPYTRERYIELTFWLMMLVATWANASFAVLLEGPVLGIPFWLFLGFAHGRALGPDGVESEAVPAEQGRFGMFNQRPGGA